VGLEITDSNLVSTEQALRESDLKAEASRAMEEYFGGLNVVLRPIFVTQAQIQAPVDAAASLTALGETRTRLRKAARNVSN